jgi:hypothetical protein
MRTSLDTNILSAVWSKEVVPATLWPSWVKQDKQGCSSYFPAQNSAPKLIGFSAT